MQHRPRQREGRSPALLGQARQRRPAGIAEAEQLGALVEGLAGGIVDGLAQQRVVAHRLDAHQLRVPPRHEQRHEREARRIGREEGRQQMPLEMVDAEHRTLERGGQRRGHAGTHQQGAGQARSPRVGHEVDVGDSQARIGEHAAHQRHDATDVVARREFGHHAPERLVHCGLTVQGLRQEAWHIASITHRHQRDARFVAGRLDTQHIHRSSVSSTSPRPAPSAAACRNSRCFHKLTFEARKRPSSVLQLLG